MMDYQLFNFVRGLHERGVSVGGKRRIIRTLNSVGLERFAKPFFKKVAFYVAQISLYSATLGSEN